MFVPLPQAVGDMAVKGTTEKDKLTYTWSGHTVDVTPRAKRPDHPKQCREMTPDRALRKMREKIRKLAKRGKPASLIVHQHGHPVEGSTVLGTQNEFIPFLRKVHLGCDFEVRNLSISLSSYVGSGKGV